MQAIVKSENKLLINGADHSEKLLIENLIKSGNSLDKETKYESVLDINGEVTGCMITIVDKESNENTQEDDNQENTNEPQEESNENSQEETQE